MFRLNISNEEILKVLNNFVEEWRSQFDNPPEKAPVNFSITDDGKLCVNGIVLLPAQDLKMESMSWEVEALFLSSKTGETYELGINWRVVGPPYLAFVNKVTTLFVAP